MPLTRPGAMRLVGVLLVVGLLLAGCAGNDPDGSGAGAQSHGGIGQDGSTPLQAPAWQLGDHWSYQLSDGSQSTLIVTGEESTDWIIDTNDPGLAFFHQAIEEFSMLGRVGKADLAGSQGADRVRFFDWPLEDGKTWSMTWDGELFGVTAHQESEGRFRMEASAAEVLRRTYVYDDAVGWIRSITIFDEEGAVEFEVRLAGQGRNYAQEFVRWDIHNDYSATITVGEGFTDFFAVPEAAQEVWYDLGLTCDPGGLEGDNGLLVLRAIPHEAPSGGLDASGVCPFTRADRGTLAPDPGDWTVNSLSMGASGHLRMVARTLQSYSL